MLREKVVKTACQLCPECCGVNVHLVENRIVSIDGMREHPWNKGKLCPKGVAIKEWVYSQDRILYPSKRENGELKRISWDEALDIMAQKLAQIKQEHGARAVAVLIGMSLLEQGVATQGLMGRFCDVFGTPNRFDVDSMCFRPRLIGYLLTLGKFSSPDVANTKCILVWGSNPRNSMPMLSQVIEERREKGAKLLVIDPRRTFWAKRADVHAQPRPATDCALAMGMLNVIISEGLYDKDFVERWTLGFERLAEHARSYPLDEVERITWVPARTIRDLARTYALVKPACIIRGGNSLDQQPSGVQISRAIAIMQAITGNLDVPGGFVTPSTLHLNSLRLPQKLEEKALGADEYPLFSDVLGKHFGDCQGMLQWDAILTAEPYPIKALIVSGCNPALTFPNSTKVREALARVDFLVVMDYFMSETAKFAHLVLPAATFVERRDICDLYRMSACLPYVIMRKKAVEIGECWSDLEFWFRLAKRMGYEEDFPWEDDKEILDYILQPSGLTVKKLEEEQSEGVMYGTIKYGEYVKQGFRTPSGKVELYLETLATLGYDPLPTHIEPPESPIRTPELAREYPLVLTTGARTLEHFHSRLRDIPGLDKKMRQAQADIHPDTAAKYGIEDGDMIVVETRRGSIELGAKVTEDIMPGEVSVPHAWPEANANLLTDETPADPISGCPALKGMLCKIRKA